MNNYVSSMRASDGSIVKFECHDALPSTARLAKQYAKINYPDRYIVFSEMRPKNDSDKRGRDGADRGIFMSCILRPSIFPSQASLISSLAAASVAAALSEHTESDIGIGWVSEIYCNGRSIGRTTLEAKLDSFFAYEYIIVNFSLVIDKKSFPHRITDLVKQVFERDNSSVELIIAKNIINKFLSYYSALKTPEKFMDIYRQKFILRGRKIRCVINGKKERCKVLGIESENCTLIVENSKKQVTHINTPNSVILPRKIK